MTEKILAILFSFISSVIAATGYAGIALLMAIESACIPLPSEIIMPFAGAVTVSAIAASYGHAPLNLWLVGLRRSKACASEGLRSDAKFSSDSAISIAYGKQRRHSCRFSKD